MANIDTAIQKAQAVLQSARTVVALTGAGISTPSGIPDFRSPTSGLWDEYDPMEVATLSSFRQRPQLFYEWMRPLAHTLLNAAPNPAHYALRDLEQHGPLLSVITQNIDMLHTKAGSQKVYEVHGHMREATCMGCRMVTSAADKLEAFLDTGQIPTCPSCGNVLKPNVILFGEMLPEQQVRGAELDMLRCDVMLVAGSSLQVAPVGDLPLQAYYNGARLIVVNYTETHVDHIADVVIRGDVADVLPRLTHPFIPT